MLQEEAGRQILEAGALVVHIMQGFIQMAAMEVRVLLLFGIRPKKLKAIIEN